VITTGNPQDFRDFLEKARRAGKEVGVHPTMGALHGGHCANISRMAAECGVAAVTIFVNPLQFGPGEDLASYPRDLERDLELAERAGADIVLAPPPEAMFAQPPLARVKVDQLGDVLEGPLRPGHFEGVATVVTKLLAITGPCWAYFGEKDYQQLAIVRRLVEDLSLPAVVVACATVREPDGLALSSRNSYLSADQRRVAPVLYWSLLAGKRLIEEHGETDVGRARAAMVEVAAREPLLDLDYAEVVGPEDLRQPKVVSGPVRLVIAGRIGRARLIDNVAAEPPGAGEGGDSSC
jgi:pantoate--beta-alanine ligase